MKKGYYCKSCAGPVDAEDSICLSCNTERRGAWPLDPYVGRKIGRKYRIDRRLGAGASGIVFAATQIHQDVELGNVIIKMLPSQFTGDVKLRKRFMNEARAARSLTNPHVVRVFDLDMDSGQVAYLVQEHVEGESLDEIILQEGKLTPARTLTIVLQIAEGMEEAHGKQILHRNLRPSNVRVRVRKTSDFVKIIGFGLYTPVGKQATLKGEGAERYLAPEQLSDGDVDERSDIYALGLMFHEMLTGTLPDREGSKLDELLADADQNLVDLVDMMIDPKPENRPANMRRVVQLLEQAAEELGMNLDITGRFTVPSDLLEQEEKPPPSSLPPELPQKRPSAPQPSRRGVHPGIYVIAVLGGVVLAGAIIVGVLECSDVLAPVPEPQETTPAHEKPPPAPPEEPEPPPPTKEPVEVEPPSPPPVEKEDAPPAITKEKAKPVKKKPMKKADKPGWTKI